MKSMKMPMKVYDLKCNGNGLISNMNKKQEIIPILSYSIMHALKEAFSIMRYSCTHDTDMWDGYVHMKYAIRLISPKGISTMWWIIIPFRRQIQTNSYWSIRFLVVDCLKMTWDYLCICGTLLKKSTKHKCWYYWWRFPKIWWISPL